MSAEPPTVAELLDRIELLDAACDRLTRQRDAALARAARAEARLAAARTPPLGVPDERYREVLAERYGDVLPGRSWAMT